MGNGWPIDSLRRAWDYTEHEINGPYWEMTFARKVSAPDDTGAEHTTQAARRREARSAASTATRQPTPEEHIESGGGETP